MKTIELSDEDYQRLMELSAEYQTQEKHCQAFPRYWEPRSKKRKPDFLNEGEIDVVFDHDASENYDLDEYAENNEERWEAFRAQYKEDHDEEAPELYQKELWREWKEFLKENYDNLDFFTENWEWDYDHNPSLFLSDVRGYISNNQHHLGREPSTYARSIWRMPKMQSLVEILCKINPQEKTEE